MGFGGVLDRVTVLGVWSGLEEELMKGPDCVNGVSHRYELVGPVYERVGRPSPDQPWPRYTTIFCIRCGDVQEIQVARVGAVAD